MASLPKNWFSAGNRITFHLLLGVSISHIDKGVEVRIDRTRQTDKDRYTRAAGTPKVQPSPDRWYAPLQSANAGALFHGEQNEGKQAPAGGQVTSVSQLKEVWKARVRRACFEPRSAPVH
jgi:hypothetical protein